MPSREGPPVASEKLQARRALGRSGFCRFRRAAALTAIAQFTYS